VQEGKLALDDDVREYLPSLSPGEQRMTIEQLLTHTSGLPSAADREDFEAIAKTDLGIEELLALTEGMSMHFPPGTGYRYSDSGYFLLEAVIEQVSGLPYAAFMASQVFEPAGLQHTRYGDGRDILPGRVPGYTRNAQGFIHAPYISMTIPYAAGGIYATVEDLADWIDVLRAGRFIEPELRDRAWSDRSLPDGTRVSYGFGWEVCEIAGERSLGHGGFINGFTANLEHLPDADVTIAVMTNQDTGEPEATYLVRRIARLLLTGEAELQPVALTAVQRAALLGSYRYENGDTRTIFERDGQVLSRRNDSDPVALVPLSAEYLAFPETEGTYGLEFHRNAIGTATRVVTRLNCSPNESAVRIAAERMGQG
jgi:CubicO group peptidase (beta-lactamase class C family)